MIGQSGPIGQLRFGHGLFGQAPVSYVKVCDAYGAGFFNIPGTDTCIKVGGRARYDAGYSASGKYFDKDGKKIVNVQDTWGQHIRGRVDLDSRTPTAYGTAQTVVSIRMNQNTGVLGDSQSPTDSIDTTFDAWKYNKYATSMEAAYIRFAGFTFGRAKEVFAQGHSLAFGANSHFPSFSNGALQLSYTALLGGGLSAQIGIEDNGDLGNQNLKGASAPYHTPYNKMPAIAGNLRLEQGWGSITASLGYAQNRSVKYDSASAPTSVSADLTKGGWAGALWTTINLDMLSKGDKLWLMGGFSNGVTAWGYKDASNASSSNARDITGIGQSYKNITCDYTSGASYCQNTKTTWISGALEHYWTPTVRQNLMAGYAKVDPGSLATAGAATTQKASFTSIGSNVIWSPTKNFDLGLEALYNRQDVSAITTTSFGCGKSGAAADCKYSGSNMFYRFRAERTF